MQDFYRPLCKIFGLVSKMNKAQFLTIGSLEVQGGRCTMVILCDEHRKKESEVAQSCPTLCDPEDYSLPGSSVHGILQARILEWVTIPSPGDLPDPRIERRSPTLEADALTSDPLGKPMMSIILVVLGSVNGGKILCLGRSSPEGCWCKGKEEQHSEWGTGFTSPKSWGDVN